MKPVRNNPLLLLGLVILAFCSGCARKKPVTAVPQAPAPVAATPQTTPEPAPAEGQPQAQASQTPAQGTPPPDQQPAQVSEEKTDEKADATKAKTGKPRPAGKRTEARNVPPKTTVVKPDGAESTSSPGQISPSLSHAEVAQAQATTEQLLQTTEANLNGIKRQLSQDEQAIVTQIRDFMAQSRQATKENDLVRAHNLAVKASLLSDELAKRR
jgi:hypothetical protein